MLFFNLNILHIKTLKVKLKEYNEILSSERGQNFIFFEEDDKFILPFLAAKENNFPLFKFLVENGGKINENQIFNEAVKNKNFDILVFLAKQD